MEILSNNYTEDEVYQRKILEVIEKDHIQTAANIARIISYDKEIIKLGHKESNIKQYVQKNIREMFGSINEWGSKGYIEQKIRCKLDHKNNRYIKLTQNQQNDFDNFYKLSGKKQIAAENFRNKYKFFPVEASMYILSEFIYFK